jgi:uncharacterized protein YceK
MKTFIITAALCLILSGCGRLERTWTAYTGELTYKCSRNGVEYVQSDSGMAVSYDQDGKPVRCKP